MTTDNSQSLREKLVQPGVTFFILPTPHFKEMLSKNEHPFIKKLDKGWKIAFLEEYGVEIHPDMIVKFLENTLDERNKFILENSEIRVLGVGDIKYGKK